MPGIDTTPDQDTPDLAPDQGGDAGGTTGLKSGTITLYTLSLLTDNFLPAGGKTFVEVQAVGTSPFKLTSATFTLTDSAGAAQGSWLDKFVDSTDNANSHAVVSLLDASGLSGAYNLAVSVVCDDGGGDPQTLVLPLDKSSLFFS